MLVKWNIFNGIIEKVEKVIRKIKREVKTIKVAIVEVSEKWV